ncbi:MAG TPA: formate dehydrogenase accessory sulfurtransferase FdhD [Candidatus Binataceae bacterium]|nr:formate dehydrogenase accessory sulfurtransferase FdhD [Candidatus Binataceae bacterium]
MVEKQLRTRTTLKWREGALTSRGDSVATEEPLEIRLGGQRFTLTMRTPGHDEELCAGFLFGEGFINSRAELGEVRSVRGPRGEPEPNALDVVLAVAADGLRERLKRNFAVTASCGICGKTSIDAIRRRIEPPRGNAAIGAQILLALASRMRAAQEVFAATGGLHAAALFDLDGRLRAIREDVGRHNAVDKLVGWGLMNELIPFARSVMTVSGRLSFEIVQKAAAAGVPILAAVSAPSSLAVELAEEAGTTLVGFLGDSSFNVYAHPARVLP